MKIAKIVNDEIVWVGDHTEKYVDKNYYPTNEVLKNDGYVHCNVYIPHDPTTQKLVESEPEYRDGFVYLVKVEDKTAVDIQYDKDIAMHNIRIKRNKLLAECDYTQLNDLKDNNVEWVAYREKLRNLPSTVDDPRTFDTWPLNPIEEAASKSNKTK